MNNFNKITLSGKIQNLGPTFLAKNGKICYRCEIVTTRLSGAKDTIPLLISVDVAPYDYMKKVVNTEPHCLSVYGHIRTTNLEIDGKRKLIQYVYVENTSENEPDEPLSENTVVVTGTLCRKPMYRHTPLGKIISDFMIAHNPNGKKIAYYIPCIAWGATAVSVTNFEVGDKITVYGRYQSRIYNKLNENGEAVPCTAFELSVDRYEKEA